MATSATANCPEGVKVSENGPLLPSGVTVGAVERYPDAPTRKTSIELVDSLVVTSSSEPLGLKVTWPGPSWKFGGLVLSRPSDLIEPGSGTTCCPKIQNPDTEPAPPALAT